MKLLYLLAAGMVAVNPLLAGTISGSVGAQGNPGASIGEAGGSDDYSSKKFKFAERVNYDNIHPFVVYIQGPVPGAKILRPLEYVHQQDATFKPHVLPVMVGTTVQWPNDDPIFHNVYSKSDTAPFDLGLYKKGDAPHQVTFTKPGEVDVFCSIHERMSCIVLVLENPYFTVVNIPGHFSLTNIPPGKYTVVAWQERLPKETTEVVVPETGDITGVKFILGPKNLPKY